MGIAHDYGVEVSDLIDEKDVFDPTALPIGEVIGVDTNEDVHIVGDGDTLETIAADTERTVDELNTLNPGTDFYLLLPDDGIIIGCGDDELVIALEDEGQGTEQEQDTNNAANDDTNVNENTDSVNESNEENSTD
ncbi:LysM peptidoglycan-binding domain-containing protein [Rossellomorea vietnamensis]|uniref:LysM peptidoglycan-binding domain-containing protein n=1 Tax=Rossellomorea vietnamensis TaxID=218284 RepID=A0A5D4NV09_9BACI|nr:LysM domain-containing protein [Rossellomorea vietnamensis]TYS16572.1 LysM peptidoglycan-binding domain-containing protein [Rossellomorea vietnamensis]